MAKGLRRVMSMFRLAGAVASLAVGALYQYLPGNHDPLAVPVSHVAQAVTAVLLLLLPVGVIWIATQAQSGSGDVGAGQRRCGRAAAGLVILAATVAVTVALFSSGLLLAGLAAVLSAYLLASVVPRLTWHGAAPAAHAHWTPRCLVALPVVALLFQVAPAGVMTERSRDAAMRNAGVLIDGLEQHRAMYGRYPASLTGAWPDYKVGVVGIAQYHYTAHGDAYTLHFEQPLPVFRHPGAREFVAYHPRGEHLVLSHASWHVTRSPSSLADRPGWHEALDARRPGWKRFRFD